VRTLTAGLDAKQPFDSAWNRARLSSARQTLLDRGVVADISVVDAAGKPLVGDTVADPKLVAARTGPMPSTSLSRCGSASMRSR
jgi:hypothetical protein